MNFNLIITRKTLNCATSSQAKIECYNYYTLSMKNNDISLSNTSYYTVHNFTILLLSLKIQIMSKLFTTKRKLLLVYWYTYKDTSIRNKILIIFSYKLILTISYLNGMAKYYNR